jgi:hypothetical protein
MSSTELQKPPTDYMGRTCLPWELPSGKIFPRRSRTNRDLKCHRMPVAPLTIGNP